MYAYHFLAEIDGISVGQPVAFAQLGTGTTLVVAVAAVEERKIEFVVDQVVDCVFKTAGL